MKVTSKDNSPASMSNVAESFLKTSTAGRSPFSLPKLQKSDDIGTYSQVIIQMKKNDNESSQIHSL